MRKLNLWGATCEEYSPSEDSAFCRKWDREGRFCKSRKQFNCKTFGLPKELRADQESDTEDL
jgi:hypothetical protein